MKKALSGFGLVVALLTVGVMMLPPAARRVLAARFAISTGAVGGITNHWIIPAYLKSCNYSATTTSNTCHSGPTVLGCVVINNAGAAGSTIKIYNQLAGNVIASVLHETIDATQVGRQFCYGKLLTGGLTIAHASGGAAADFTVTYQGQ